jgi:translation elongation factor EF-Ts
MKLDGKLLRILQETEGGITRISAALNHHADADAIGSALERLKVKGLAKSKKKTTEGRSAELWVRDFKGRK